MLKRLSTILAVLVLALIFVRCQRPSFVLDQKRMAAVTKDMILTEAYLQQNYQPDSVAALYYESILEKHGVSREKYDSSLVWYSENSYRLADIYALIGKELTETKNLVDTFLSDSLQRHRIRFERTNFESGNLWANSARLVIPASMTLWPYTQNLTPLEPFEPSDTIHWSADIIGTPPATLDLTAQLLIVSQLGYRYQKLTSIPTIEGQKWESRFVLPDSLPDFPRYTLILLLKKSAEPLHLQHISMGKALPPQLEVSEMPELERADNPEGEIQPTADVPQ